ncbi:MAG: tryptophan--tRNA ligase, partial [Patescibacteria group bacterium]|nr:tryptophan--tRNA ligase [Patescibacteria group bacterium]
YQCYFMIADYHALNLIQNAAEMRENIVELAIDYLAIGLDPKKAVIFKQSDVSAHTELAWIFDSITTMPYLMRAHAYKDAAAHDKEINVGTFNYPMLMAADILLYDADVVPVGADQKQHVEYARDTAQKFNNIFSPVFKLPNDLIIENVKTVPGTDGRKMSKSYGNTIGLFATDDEIRKAVMSIVTDSGAAGSSGVPVNVRAIHDLFRDKAYLDKLYEEKKGRYKDLKDALVADIQDFIRPLRERREEIATDRKKVIKILEKGATRARAVADETLERAKQSIGVTIK